MSITIGPPLENELRAKASAEGITVEEYLERLLRAEHAALGELERLALEGLNSGDAISAGPDYWAKKHLHLDERTKNLR